MSTYIEDQIRRTRKMVERWHGASAELWELTTSHKSLRVVFSRNHDYATNLMISCLEPDLIRAPVRWENSEVHLRERDGKVLLIDIDADVEVVCGAFEVRENTKLWRYAS